MSFDYQYIDLTPAQKAARREALDRAGHLVVLLQLAVFTAYHLRRHIPLPHRLHSLLTSPLSLNNAPLRTPGDWLLLAAYTALNLHLAVRGTSPDWLHITKAFGQIAAANLPVHFLLASKRLFPALLAGRSYERNVFWHQWIGRVIALFASLHFCFYLQFFYDTNRMGTRFWENDVQCGVWGYLLWCGLSAMAAGWVRQHAYRLFFAVHALAPLVFPLLFFHVQHLRPYVWAALAVWLVDGALRWKSQVEGTARVSVLTQELLALDIRTEGKRFRPGSHVRIAFPGISKLHSNPFTIASAAPGGIKVVARVRGGVTRVLMGRKEEKVVLEGPYGQELETGWDRLLVVAGGVGGTFCVPVVAAAVNAGRTSGLRFVWAVRSVEDCIWGLQEEGVAQMAEVYITGREPGELQDREVVEKLAALGVRRERIKFGRPDLKKVVGDLVEGEGRKKEVVCCGPEGMGMLVRREVASGRRRGWVGLHVEEFGH